MLSYRHSFHAGGFADVIKHIVVIEILQHLVGKDRAFHYIDTHAGAGLYDLRSEHADKLQEYVKGFGKLTVEALPELASYFAIVKKYNPTAALNYYPGSPLIAAHFLRSADRSWLFELHPADFALLQQQFAADRRVRVMREDGFKGLLSLLPPVSQRGLVLVDPSYEVKTDYAQVFETVARAHKKFPTGIYALWYPVVDRTPIDALEKKFIGSGIRRIQRFELGVSSDAHGKGLSAAGMIVINPPWMLLEKMAALLPKLVAALATGSDGFFQCQVLAGE